MNPRAKTIAVRLAYVVPVLAVIIVSFQNCGGLGNTGAPFHEGPNNSSASTVTKIFVGGSFTSYNTTSENFVAEINSDGSLNSVVSQVGTGLNNGIDAMAIDSSGKIVVGGTFTTYNGAPAQVVARLNTNGSLDSSFNPVGSGLQGQVAALAIDSSGKIVVGGYFNNYSGTSEPYVARLNTNGSLDSTFNPVGSGLNNAVTTLAIDSSDRILVGGYFTSYNGTSVPYLARLNSDGSLDSTFNSGGSGLGASLTRIIIDSTGRIIVAGGFSSYNGTTEPYIARINTNGTLDSTFNSVGTGLNIYPNAMAIDTSGKIVVGGPFSSYNGISVPGVARLNTNGSLDSTFTPVGTGFNQWVTNVAIDSTGKIMVAGAFSNYNGISEPYIARLNTNGTLDSTFNSVGTGLNGIVGAMVVIESTQ